MINWILIIIAFLIVLSFLKVEHFTRIFIFILLLSLFLFLFFSFNKMIKRGEISFDSPRSTLNAFITYGRYIENETKNIFNTTKKGINFVGDVIRG